MLKKYTSDLTKLQIFNWTLKFQEKNQFQKRFFKTILSHIRHRCLESDNDFIATAMHSNMMLHFNR